MKYILYPIFLFIFGCGVDPVTESSSSSPSEGPYVPTKANIYLGDINFNQAGSTDNYTFDGRDLFPSKASVSAGYTFSLASNPVQLSVHATTGLLTLDGSSAAAGVYQSIKIIANENAGPDVQERVFSVALNGDPLREHSWHIENTGQKTFSRNGGDIGFDLNVSPVFKGGITGDGVKIAISDSGVEINHDDLVENTLLGEHRNYSLNSPYIGDPVPTSAHGTAVTGIINAVGWNNMGSIGVAPGAKFAGFQFLNSTQSTTLLINQASGDFNIFNYSYGDAIFSDTLSEPDYIDHLRHQTIVDNKVFVKAAGNEFLLGVGSTCAPHSSNFPFENESPFMIIVGAVSASSTNSANPTAIKSIYSNTGSNIWVSAPGGEYGKDHPAILSADLPSCLKGYSKAASGLSNSFEYGHSLNTKCNYTSTMNGTSAAAPMVTGVIALMLEAKPSLKMRDIKHILATTAVKINPDHDDNYFTNKHPSNAISGCSNQDLAGHTYELGWVPVENTSGYNLSFNNFYGFGMVDAHAAVEAAKVYSFNLGTQIEQNPGFNLGDYTKSGLSLAIPNTDGNPAVNVVGVTSSITVAPGNAIKVESVQVKIGVTHPQSGQVGIELTSPQGTKSILMNINNSFLLLDSDEDGNIDGDSNLNIVLTTNAFYGESSEGVWTVKAIDGKSDTIAGTLTSWSMNILGHN